MKRVFIVCAIALCLAACGKSNEANSKTVGVIDFEYIIVESKAGKQAQADASAFEQTTVEERLVPMQQALVTLQNEFNAATTDAERASKAQQFENARAEYDALAQEVGAQVQNNNVALSENLVAEINTVIAEVAKAKNINFLSNKASVVYTDENVPDITEDVLVRYNMRFDGK